MTAAVAYADEDRNDEPQGETTYPEPFERSPLHAEARQDLRRVATDVRRERAAARRRAERRRAERAERVTLVRTQGRSGSAGSGSAGVGPIPAALQSIAACESGGDPSAIGGGGMYRGKYQFTYETWAALGGSGDPAAAPEAEQDRMAAALYAQQGSSPWPTCGG